MNKPNAFPFFVPLAGVLLFLLAIIAVLAAWYSFQYRRAIVTVVTVQTDMLRHNENLNRTRAALQNVVREAAEYAKTNPAINPILQMVGVNPPAPAAAPAAKPTTKR
jgi:hypothetical protein